MLRENKFNRTFNCVSCKRDKEVGNEACCKRCYQEMVIQITNKYSELSEYKHGLDIQLINNRLDYLSEKMNGLKEDMFIIKQLLEKKFKVKLPII